MKSKSEILVSVIKLKYDMRVEFEKDDDPKLLQAIFWLRHQDGTSEKAGRQIVSVEFMQQVPDDTIKQQFQQTADHLISDLSR